MHLGTLLIPYLPDPTPFISTVAFSSIVRLTQPRGGHMKFFLVAGLREDNVPQTSFEEAPDDYVCTSAEQLEATAALSELHNLMALQQVALKSRWPEKKVEKASSPARAGAPVMPALTASSSTPASAQKKGNPPAK